jgi:hypothetical protein
MEEQQQQPQQMMAPEPTKSNDEKIRELKEEIVKARNTFSLQDPAYNFYISNKANEIVALGSIDDLADVGAVWDVCLQLGIYRRRVFGWSKGHCSFIKKYETIFAAAANKKNKRPKSSKRGPSCRFKVIVKSKPVNLQNQCADICPAHWREMVRLLLSYEETDFLMCNRDGEGKALISGAIEA